MPFNNMRTPTFEAQPTIAFFTTINQMFGSSSQLLTTDEHMVIKLLCIIQTTKQCSAVVVSWEDLPNIWLMAAKNAFVGLDWNLRVRMLLKGTVISYYNSSTKTRIIKALFTYNLSTSSFSSSEFGRSFLFPKTKTWQKETHSRN